MTPILESTWVIPTNLVGQFEDHLFNVGVYSVTTFNRSPSETDLTCTYPDTFKADIARLNPFSTRPITDADWQNRWLDDYSGTRLCHDRLLIEPAPGTKIQRPENTIWLDPKSAFGDGHHPTTRACADAIADAVCQQPIISMADLGCGTGILSLVAAALGVQTRFALDFDLDSVNKTRQNSELNHLVVQVHHGDVQTTTPPRRFDLVVANLQSVVLETLIPTLHAWCNPRHRVILSGVHQTWAPQIEIILKDNQFNIFKIDIKNEWAIFIGEFRFAGPD